MNQPVRIRKIDKAEIGTIIRLAEKIWPETYKNILSPRQIDYMMTLMYSHDALESQMEKKGHQFLVLESGEEPVGFASFSESSEPGRYTLHKIYVTPSLQGKGLGKMMIEYIAAEILAAKAHALELNVNRNNHAKVFYEKLGFRVIREEDIDIGNGFFMNDYVMRLELGSKDGLRFKV